MASPLGLDDAPLPPEPISKRRGKASARGATTANFRGPEGGGRKMQFAGQMPEP